LRGDQAGYFSDQPTAILPCSATKFSPAARVWRCCPSTMAALPLRATLIATGGL